mmetsp:Transcript_31943/g.56690  ORF Transcript_31943/g.56690 Transcript_31943/m.56690 type:complete len:125 (+) Transcript_31943:1-375(+)
MAAQFGFVEALRLLVSMKASIDLRNKASETALLLAAQEGFLEAISFLLEEGSQAVNMAAADGRTPLIAAERFGNDEVCRFLLHRRADPHTKIEGCAGMETSGSGVDSARQFSDHQVRLVIEQSS